MSEIRDYDADSLAAGIVHSFEKDLTELDISAFAQVSGDFNPLHVDAAYAATTTYGGCIAHGALQIAYASAMAGMYLPGRHVVVGAMRASFMAPLHVPSRIRVSGEIVSWIRSSLAGSLRVRVTDLGSSVVTAEIHVGFTLHGQRSPAEAALTGGGEDKAGAPLVLVTGAHGGVGTQLVDTLSTSYSVLGVSRRQPEAAMPHVQYGELDLSAPGWESTAAQLIAGRPLYGIVHAAWPGAPSASLLDGDIETVSAQMEFGAHTTIRLARFLTKHAQGPGRLVILGSTAATIQPQMQMGAYSLGKAIQEHAVKLLAPELARKKITVNIVVPSYMTIGMNKSKPDRAALREAAMVPAGRLCDPADVSNAVVFLLSPGSEFITGQLLPLTGGRLT